jgi:hypothetical protein
MLYLRVLVPSKHAFDWAFLETPLVFALPKIPNDLIRAADV